MRKGIVKWFNEQTGIGLIVPNEPGPDVVVLAAAIATNAQTLRQGEAVVFDIDRDGSGRHARQVSPDPTMQ